MPLIADPGFELSRAAVAAGVPLTCAPGPSAALTALALGGLPTDAFHFAGFLPAAGGARRTALEGLQGVTGTLVLYESPKRLNALLTDARAILGPARRAAVCRELTKKFEEVRRGTLDTLAQHYADAPPKGEIVVLIDRRDSDSVNHVDIDQALREALQSMSMRDAADAVSRAHGLSRRKVYQAALALDKEG